jgi:hypothetical protein
MMTVAVIARRIAPKQSIAMHAILDCFVAVGSSQ